MTEQELAVIKALLPHGDSRSELLWLQAVEAPEVRRTLLGKHIYRAAISYVTTDRYLIDVDQELTSPALAVTDGQSGRKLVFTATILRGGFLGYLQGAATDGGEWPMEWAPVIEPNAARNWLPPTMTDSQRERIVSALAAWAGVDSAILRSQDARSLRLVLPAAREEVTAAEDRLACPLPREYRDFVQTCNGLTICLEAEEPCEIYGTREVYVCDSNRAGRRLVVITSLREDGVIALVCEGTDAGSVMAIRPGETPQMAGDFRSHVKTSLERLWWSGTRRPEARDDR
jgi:hypothetical protein